MKLDYILSMIYYHAFFNRTAVFSTIWLLRLICYHCQLLVGKVIETHPLPYGLFKHCFHTVITHRSKNSTPALDAIPTLHVQKFFKKSRL